jgi:hypothetical protein
MALCIGQGCPAVPPPNGEQPAPVYPNTTDRSNGGASYVGSATCKACHLTFNPGIVAGHELHGHSNALNRVDGAPPVFPAGASQAAVPQPPSGVEWFDVAYVLGGYIRKARFIDREGYLLTDDSEGVNTQWNLAYPVNGSAAGFVANENQGTFSPTHRKPYDHACFVCHTTGPLSLAQNGGRFQDGRPGHAGTWVEEGVQCEACHGPGSRHLPNPAARDLYVDTSGRVCNECHNRPFGQDGSVIQARDGFIENYEQRSELAASGGHANLTCTACHSPHHGTNYDLRNAITTQCTDCHANQNMAIHQNKVYVRDGYVEPVTCVSCHMPLATRSAGTAGADLVGDLARVGDTRTHIFRINTDRVDYTAMFTASGTEVVKDTSGRAAVTLDFVCLRCHNGAGNGFELSLRAASEIGLRMHGK